MHLTLSVPSGKWDAKGQIWNCHIHCEQKREVPKVTILPEKGKKKIF